MLWLMCGEIIEEIKRHAVSYIYYKTFIRRVFNSSQQQLIILTFSWIYCEGIIERLISRSVVKGSDLKRLHFS